MYVCTILRCPQFGNIVICSALWKVSPVSPTGSDTTLTVIAPRSFTYLRRLAGLDCEALLTELLQTNVGGLKVAAKSGSSLLCSSDNRTFVLKTISKSEVKQVRAMLAEYRALELHHGLFFTPSIPLDLE